jgi:hypothetical protein
VAVRVCFDVRRGQVSAASLLVEDDVLHRRQGDAEALHRARVRDINEVMSMGD